MNRRELLKSSGVAIVSTASGLLTSCAETRSTGELSPTPVGFNHRGYLGWITDLSTEPDPEATWPSMRLDQALLEDYRRTFSLMNQLGFNSMSVWGLYVSRSWPVDIERAVSPGRGRLVERLIEQAHSEGIRVYTGLGVYSWGFDEIIRAHPGLSQGNESALCASRPESWEWMRRVIDFVFERFPIDGVSMQSADLGRCPCSLCSAYSDAEYHALINVRCAKYIRENWPEKVIAVNSWGMRFEKPETLPALVEMSRYADYLLDIHDTSRKRNRGYREEIIDALECDFGTLGGPQVEPPQHWERDRWFLPTLKGVGEHLEELALDGGAACEYFFHILANPGDELSFWLAGKVLHDPTTSWREHLRAAVGELYEPSGRASDDLCELFLDAEAAYFQHLPEGLCKLISMEPLVSSEVGPPVYLTEGLTKEQATRYRADLVEIGDRALALGPEVGRREKLERIQSCIQKVIEDIDESAL